MEVCKAILAAQRDHGDREVRANARMKYLVHSLGIDAFRTLVESYAGMSIAPWQEMVPWKYSDWPNLARFGLKLFKFGLKFFLVWIEAFLLWIDAFLVWIEAFSGLD